jgi:hypothetical protein
MGRATIPFSCDSRHHVQASDDVRPCVHHPRARQGSNVGRRHATNSVLTYHAKVPAASVSYKTKTARSDLWQSTSVPSRPNA